MSDVGRGELWILGVLFSLLSILVSPALVAFFYPDPCARLCGHVRVQ